MTKWSPQLVEALNKQQRAGQVHPFTCGSGRRTDADHKDGEGVLVATEDGWMCPYCDYRQDWHGGVVPVDELVANLRK